MKMLYGHDNTIHQTTHLDIEQDGEGKVIAVWFRCASLPFEAHKVGDGRIQALSRMDIEGEKPKMLAVEIEWPEAGPPVAEAGDRHCGCVRQPDESHHEACEQTPLPWQEGDPAPPDASQLFVSEG